MDTRLLTAINDVLENAGIGTAVAVSTATEAGPAVRKSMLRKAATKNASTGTPIPSLRGIAADRATMAAVAGGAEAAGGGGIIGGERALNQAELKIQLATYGITAVAVVAEIGIRYAALVAQDWKAARSAAAASDKDERPSH
ncbi:MAG: hypothetical protein KF692_04660 [Cryobacterium sp.]|nr:hypothetical protein [Cryobacterium sp.]